MLTVADCIALAKKHEHWQRGLLWTLQNHPRVPENIRKQYWKWGLPKDEFTDNDYWPHQLYVREGRRMVSDFVMTEHHCTRKQPVPESIGLAAYTMDSHNVQRHVKTGMVKNEGDVQENSNNSSYGMDRGCKQRTTIDRLTK